MAEWTHRICERCWFDSPVSDLDDPPGAVRMPVQVLEQEPGVCCTCGGLCITAIFMRANENTLLCKGKHDDIGSWSQFTLGTP